MDELRQVKPKPAGRQRPVHAPSPRARLSARASAAGQTRLWRLVWRVLTDIPNLDAAGLAAEIAFRSFAAILPTLVFSAAVFTLVAPLFGGPNVRLHVEESIAENLPPSAASFVLPYITSIFRANGAPALSLGLVLSLWTISSVITTVMKAASRILRMPDHRSFAHRHLVALVLSAYLPALLGGGLALTWFGQRLQAAVHNSALGFDLPSGALQVGGSLLLGCLAIWILFRIAAPRHLPRLPRLAGTVFTVAGFWIASQIFALYAAAFAHYHSAYGVLGGTLALLVWLYVSAFVLLGGLELIALAGYRLQGTGNRNHGQRNSRSL